MDYYWCTAQREKGVDGNDVKLPRGRPATTLPVLLFKELKEFCQKEREKNAGRRTLPKGQFDTAAKIALKTKPQMDKLLMELRSLAQERSSWNSLVKPID